MACSQVVKIKSWVKGHHFYNCKYIICEELEWLSVPEKPHSEHAISVHSKRNNTKE